MAETKKGKELEFISWIKRDGTGTIMIGSCEWNSSMDMPKIDDMGYVDDEDFNLTGLSLTEKTFIASGFNSFVVKLKPEPPKPECLHPFNRVVRKSEKNYCEVCEKYI